MPQAAPIAPESRRVVESKLMSLLGLGESGIQGGPLIWPRYGIHKTKAGSCKLSQPGAPSYSGGVTVGPSWFPLPLTDLDEEPRYANYAGL